MVLTRNNRRQLGFRHTSLSQHALRRMRASRRWPKQYRTTDTAKRHRIRDGQPKSQRVVSYVRRI